MTRTLKILAFGTVGILASLSGHAQTSATTAPVGFVEVKCLSGSDTRVSVPFHEPSEYVGALSATPAINGGSATIAVATSPGWADNEFANLYYIRFTSGTKEGYWFTVTANTSSSLTIDLNGDGLSGVAAGSGFKVVRHWTLETLFPIGNSTIHQSDGLFIFQRKTQILFPDMERDGINLAANRVFFQISTGWKEASAGTPDANNVIILPDMFFIIRHRSTDANTFFLPSGTVEIEPVVSQLHSITSSAQDNFVALSRPVPVKLKDSNLVESGAFAKSTGLFIFQRTDQLLVFDNSKTGVNKAASSVYFHDGTNWRSAAAGTPIADDDEVFQPGTGVVVRKKATTSAAVVDWKNNPTF